MLVINSLHIIYDKLSIRKGFPFFKYILKLLVPFYTEFLFHIHHLHYRLPLPIILKPGITYSRTSKIYPSLVSVIAFMYYKINHTFTYGGSHQILCIATFINND